MLEGMHDHRHGRQWMTGTAFGLTGHDGFGEDVSTHSVVTAHQVWAAQVTPVRLLVLSRHRFL
jgi:hypothetical protein